MAEKKYKLFKADGASGDAPPCAFFLSPQGCRNGDKCKFSHKIPSKDQPPVTIEESSSDVVSSESEDESGTEHQQQKDVKTTTPKAKTAEKKQVDKTESSTTDSKKKRKRKNQEDGVNISNGGSDPDLGLFAKPPKRANKGKEGEASSVQSPKQATTKASTTPKSVKVNLPPPPQSSTPTPKPKATSAKKKAKPAVNEIPNFRSLNLPITGFSTETGVDRTSSTTNINDNPSNQNKKGNDKYPLPKSTPEGLKWQNAVIASRSNPKFESIFSYDKMKELDEESGIIAAKDWIKAKQFGNWCSNNPHAIAIDCEMCATKCPDTGNMDHKALCRLSIVNAMNPDDVLIDTLVKPDWPIVDYRSRINGIKEDDLENVEFTLRHAQMFMMALCSDETVIIGHAIHNDLAALKMEHYCVVDSALLFTCKDAPDATCSLKDLAKSVMKKDMPNIHCSLNDARTTLFCIEEGYVKKDGKPEPIERTLRDKKKGMDELFVHRIPKGMKPEHIKNMFLTYTFITPEEVPDIVFGADTGKTTVTFASAQHANLAFKSLDGDAAPDKTGRMQKRIYLRNGSYAYVRKMTMDKKKPISDSPEKKDQHTESE